MLTFISCAKTMASHCSLKVPEVTVPYFEAEAVRNALEMSQVLPQNWKTLEGEC